VIPMSATSDVPAVDELDARIGALLDAGRTDEATAVLLRVLGGALHGYLVAVLRDETRASDAFAEAAEDLWKGLPGFRRECPVRSWAYRVARHAALRVARDPFQRRGRPFATAELSRLVDEVRSSTAAHPRTDVKDGMRALRASLTPDEQTLLILRIDRDLPWREVAEVLEVDEPAARKRFERVKARLAELARERGLL